MKPYSYEFCFQLSVLCSKYTNNMADRVTFDLDSLKCDTQILSSEA